VYHAEFSAGATEAAGVRLLAVDDDPGGNRYPRLFLSDAGDSARVAAIDSFVRTDGPAPWLLYLQGRIALRLGDYERALALLGSVTLEETDVQLEAVRLRAQGECLFRLGRFEEARPKFWSSLNMVSSAAAEAEVNTWIDRCEWMHAHAN